MPYITTYTGRKFPYNNINKDYIHIPDILHALPRINRFTGHSQRPYSVGEHTFLGFVMAEKLGYTPLQKLYWLIHDFTEAYVGDCNAPLKSLLPEFKRIEAEVEKAILDHLGLKPLTDEDYLLVKRIDLTMLVLEMRDLTLHNHEDFINEFTYTEMLYDEDFNIAKSKQNDELITSILKEVLEELLEEVNLKTFKIFAGTSDGRISEEKELQFNNEEEALEYAKQLSFDLYNLNPEKDILEISEELEIDEGVAEILYTSKMINSIVFSVEEVIKGV